MKGQGGLARRSIVGILWTGLSMGALAVAELVALLVLARLLSPAEFGLYAAALVVIKFSAIFENLGVTPAIVQRPVLEVRHLRVGFTLSMLLSLAVSAAVWVSAPVIAAYLRLADLVPVVRVACIILLCQGFSTVALASAQRALRFRWLATLDACAFAAGFIVVGPALALLGYGVWALVGALATQHLLRMAVLLLGQPHPKRPMLELRAAADLLYFGGGFTLARICNYLATQVDRLVVGRWLGADALGVYALASQVMTAPAVIIGQILDRVLFPTMARVQEEPARLARAYRSGVAACALLVLPAGLTLAVIAPELVLVVLGPRWAGVAAPLQILALGMLFRTSYKLSDSVTRATGVVYARAWRQAAFALAVALGALVGSRWGVAGVAFGVVAAVAFNFLLMAQLSLRVTGVRWPEFAAAHLPGLALAAVVGAGVWTMADWLRGREVSPLLLLLDVVVFALVISLVVCWLLPAVFLGRDGRSVLGLLVSLAPAWLRRGSAG
ncbi:lipopolysaccharide biosynthesis protein [Nitratireductor sp. ZSWI3]|uniref:lipopolysaccharide biosynthesis protein n=1 Tax=Nitratireductor sp. ZSWI3 TaxID=2966359 RepID=UPI00214FEC6F|nr:lipopolysaccharide biosynthesis protein [Nitratireductor sp. ZSWI3]MCR4267614.1 lipopolysaccharide biosynthesis protein [Nitratireductor sp. ZSWI3]